MSLPHACLRVETCRFSQRCVITCCNDTNTRHWIRSLNVSANKESIFGRSVRVALHKEFWTWVCIYVSEIFIYFTGDLRSLSMRNPIPKPWSDTLQKIRWEQSYHRIPRMIWGASQFPDNSYSLPREYWTPNKSGLTEEINIDINLVWNPLRQGLRDRRKNVNCDIYYPGVSLWDRSGFLQKIIKIET